MSSREDINIVTDPELQAQMGPYMESRPFRNNDGSVYSPGGTMFADADGYFDLQRQLADEAGNVAYEDMSVYTLARMLAYAEYEDDLTSSENIKDALLERLAAEETKLSEDDEKYALIEESGHAQQRSDELWDRIMAVKDSEFQRLYDTEVLGNEQADEIDLGRRLRDVHRAIREVDTATLAHKGIFDRIRDKFKRPPPRYGHQPYEHKRRMQATIAAVAVAAAGIMYAITQTTPSVHQGKLMDTPSNPNKRPRTVFDAPRREGKDKSGAGSTRRESTETSTKTTNTTKRTIELATGGNVWDQSKVVLGRYGILATKNKKINDVKNAVLMRYGITEQAAYGLPVGARYIIPQKAIRRVLQENDK